eukprot:TRINITY_DN4967_c0_g1_i2.p1 TRINITY_DN4967_c0_g1~~TRINITY_DN4967_c0_g1_i2.p1  ORF type:complete len:115 (-),score=15.50 TRINITY_DN4967_c0_g1_i2:27-371(-)
MDVGEQIDIYIQKPRKLKTEGLHGCWTRSGLLVTGGEDKMVRVWDVQRGKDSRVGTLAGSDAAICSVAVPADDQRFPAVACGNNSRMVYVYTPTKLHMKKPTMRCELVTRRHFA